MIHRKLWLAVFAADIAEAVLNANDGDARGNMQYIHHVDMTTRERPINPGGLQDVELVGSCDGKPVPNRVGDSFYNGGAIYHHRRHHTALLDPLEAHVWSQIFFF